MTSFSLSSLRVYLAPCLHISTGLISVVVIGFLTIAAVIFQACLHHHFHLQSDLKQATLEVENLRQQKQSLDQFEKTKKEMSQAFKAFQKKGFGDDLTPDVIQHHFQKWQKSGKNKAKFTTLNVKFGNQICHDTTLNLWRVPIVVTLKSLKDSQIYDFLFRIQNQLPGKVVLKQFSLKRIAALTPQMVKQITLGKKGINLFESKIEFDWIYSQKTKESSSS